MCDIEKYFIFSSAIAKLTIRCGVVWWEKTAWWFCLRCVCVKCRSPHVKVNRKKRGTMFCMRIVATLHFAVYKMWANTCGVNVCVCLLVVCALCVNVFRYREGSHQKLFVQLLCDIHAYLELNYVLRFVWNK